MIPVAISPGTGPVPDATEQTAWKLMGEFAGELGQLEVEVVAIRRGHPCDSGDGRFRFHLEARKDVDTETRSFEIEMPGVDVTAESTVWVSPRLYVDGSSWLWGFAVSIVAGHVLDDD